MTEHSSQQASDHPVDGSPIERARYLTMLGRWARGDDVGAVLDTNGSDDLPDRGPKN